MRSLRFTVSCLLFPYDKREAEFNNGKLKTENSKLFPFLKISINPLYRLFHVIFFVAL